VRGLGSFILGVAVLLSTTVAVAQTDQERAAARSLATEGINAFNAGRNAEALDKLERAYQLAAIPTIGLWSARALEKAGKLVEANERLLAVGRYAISKDDSGVFAQAQKEAEQMQDKLGPRVPELKVELVNGEGLQFTADLDGVVLKTALLGVPFQLNPGKHTVTVKTRTGQVQKAVSVVERESARVSLDLTELKKQAEAAPPEAAPAEGRPANTGAASISTDAAPPSSGSGRRVVGFVSLGIGGAGLVAGAVLGAKAIEQHSTYEQKCPDGMCTKEYQGYYDTLQKNQTYALVAGGIGVVGVGVGLVLLLTGGSSSASTSQAHVRPLIGLNTLGAEGRF
jgi:hypothetical protein